MNQANLIPSADRAPLAPLTIGQAIGRAFSLYRKLPPLVWLLIVVITVPLTAVSLLAGEAIASSLDQSGIDLNALSANGTAALSALSADQLTALTSRVLGAAIALVIVAFIGIIARSVLIDSLLAYITAEYQLGRTVTFGAALGAVRDRWLTLATGQFLFYLLLTGLTIGLAFILFACGLGFGLLAFIYVALGLLITPVLTLERSSATEGMGRAWQLGKARFWAFVAMLIVSFVFSFVVNHVLDLVSSATPTTVSDLTVSVVLASLGTIVVSPLLPIGVTILYLDTRVRLEGFGEAIHMLPKSDPRPADVLPPTPLRAGFTNNDWINLALVTAGVIVLLLAYAVLTFALTPPPLP